MMCEELEMYRYIYVLKRQSHYYTETPNNIK